PPFTAGQLGTALHFDGATNYVDMGDPADNHLDIGANATIETWVKFDSLPSGNFYTFASKDVGGGSQDKWIFGYANNYGGILNATMFHINGINGSVFLQSNSWTPVIGQWYHLAVVKSGTTYTFYRNGVADGTVNSINVPDVASSFLLGQSEGGFRFAG